MNFAASALANVSQSLRAATEAVMPESVSNALLEKPYRNSPGKPYSRTQLLQRWNPKRQAVVSVEFECADPNETHHSPTHHPRPSRNNSNTGGRRDRALGASFSGGIQGGVLAGVVPPSIRRTSGDFTDKGARSPLGSPSQQKPPSSWVGSAKWRAQHEDFQGASSELQRVVENPADVKDRNWDDDDDAAEANTSDAISAAEQPVQAKDSPIATFNRDLFMDDLLSKPSRKSSLAPAPISSGRISPITPAQTPPPGLLKVKPEDVMWQYKDPSGQIQGPFRAIQMQEWFDGNYFVDTLLVKRTTDSRFEPLSTLLTNVIDIKLPFLSQTKPRFPPGLDLRQSLPPSATAPSWTTQDRSVSQPPAPEPKPYQEATPFQDQKPFQETDIFGLAQASSRYNEPSSIYHPPIPQSQHYNGHIPSDPYMIHSPPYHPQMPNLHDPLNSMHLAHQPFPAQHQHHIPRSDPWGEPIQWNPPTSQMPPVHSPALSQGHNMIGHQPNQHDTSPWAGFLSNSMRQQLDPLQQISTPPIPVLETTPHTQSRETFASPSDSIVEHATFETNSYSQPAVVSATEADTTAESEIAQESSIIETGWGEPEPEQPEQSTSVTVSTHTTPDTKPVSLPESPVIVQDASKSTSLASSPAVATPAVSKAPWLREERAASISAAPSLRDIQELEAKAAAERKAKQAAILAEARAQAAQIAAESAINVPAVLSPSITGGAPWSKPVSSAGAKKTLKEIQEEEAKRKASAVAQAPSSQPAARAYASSAAAKPSPAAVVAAIPAGSSAWTVVGAPKVSAPVSKVATPIPTPKPITPSATPKPMSVNIIRPSSSRPASSSNINGASSLDDDSTPPPSLDMLKWCREALKGLSVNLDEFIQMLFTFPLNPDPTVVEIISDSVYANSSTLDGRRFAQQFVQRRKADALAKNKTNGAIAVPGAIKSAADILKMPAPKAKEPDTFRIVQKKNKKKA